MVRTSIIKRFFRLFFRHGRPTLFLLSIVTVVVVWHIFHPPWNAAHAIDASEIIDASEVALESRNDATGRIWQAFFFPPSPTYQSIVYLASIIAGLLLVLVLGRWMSITDDYETIDQIKTDFIWILVLIFALANSGQLFASMVYLEKGFADGILNQIDEFTSANIRFQQANALSNLDSVLAPRIKACEGKVGQPQIECLTEAYKSASRELDNIEKKLGGGSVGKASAGFLAGLERWRARLVSGYEFVTDPDKNVLDKAATVFWSATSPAWEGIVKAISTSFNTGAFIIIDCLTIALALGGPIAAALSVIPVPSYAKVFVIWQTAFIALYTWKTVLIFLDYISSEFLLASNADVDTIWFGVVTGLLFPLMSLAGILFGANQLFQTVSSISNTISGAVSTAAQKLGPKSGSSGASSSGGGSSGSGSSSAPKGKPQSSKAVLFR